MTFLFKLAIASVSLIYLKLQLFLQVTMKDINLSG